MPTSDGGSFQMRGGRGKSAKWSTLRNAFLSAVEASKAGDDEGKKDAFDTCNLPPMFEGFVLFPRNEDIPSVAPTAPVGAAGAASGELVSATYTLPHGKKVVTREVSSGTGGRRRASRTKITLDQIFAHRVHGVDNTGNVRVWPAEEILLHLLLSGPLASLLEGARVLELGAGMSGLAGLGVAACSQAAEVVVTDGNPDALKNLEACVELNAKEGVFGDTNVRVFTSSAQGVSARRLVWDSRDGNGDRAALLKSSAEDCDRFDVVIASDCLFFKDFHNDLITTIDCLLKPGGRAVLVQPQRGGTVDRFVQRVAAASTGSASAVATATTVAATEVVVEHVPPRLKARLLERFDDQVWEMHQGYLQGSKVAVGGSGSGGGGCGCGGSSSGDRPLVFSSPEAEAAVAYLPDEHQPLLVEMIKTAMGGNATEVGAYGARLVESTESQASGRQWSWIPWPGVPTPDVALGNARETVADSRSDHHRGARGVGDGGFGGGSEGERSSSARDISVQGASASPLAVPPLPPSPPPPRSNVIAAADEKGHHEHQQRQQRPDRRMTHVYEALAERLRLRVKETRNMATPEAGGVGGKVDGAGSVEGAVTQAAEEAGAAEGGDDTAVEARQQRPRDQLWVAVAGAPGSGKSTLAAEVCRRLQSTGISAVCLPMDGYHFYRRNLDLLPDPKEAHRRRGAHWTFDGRRFLREVAAARRSGDGSFPGFDHAEGDPVENQWTVSTSHAVVIVEGNYLLLKGVAPWDEASGLFDETWAIRCHPEVCGERVRKRHIQTGLGEEEARSRVEGNDLPNARLVAERCPWEEVDVVVDSL